LELLRVKGVLVGVAEVNVDPHHAAQAGWSQSTNARKFVGMIGQRDLSIFPPLVE
jgi:hypothetical protein